MDTSIEHRIIRLEKALRFYQFNFFIVIVFAIVFALVSFNNKEKKHVEDKIIAKAFEVVDDAGNPLVRLSVSAYTGNGDITTLDKRGNDMVNIGSNKFGFGNVNLYDSYGNRTIRLYNVIGGGGALSIINKVGRDALYLSATTSGSGNIELNHSAGQKLMFLGETTDGNADLKMYNSNGRIASRLTATNVNDGSLELFNNTGNRMVHVTTDVNGKGAVVAYSAGGTLIGRVPQQ